jgi:hypothetical protein
MYCMLEGYSWFIEVFQDTYVIFYEIRIISTKTDVSGPSINLI